LRYLTRGVLDLLRLPLVGDRHKLVFGVEQIAFLHAVQSQETEERGIMILKTAVFEDVPDVEASFVKISADQYRPMAAEWFFLGAQDRDPKIFHPRPQTLDAPFKNRSPGNQRVLRPTLPVAGGVV
jgi:hypothetical protein